MKKFYSLAIALFCWCTFSYAVVSSENALKDDTFVSSEELNADHGCIDPDAQNFDPGATIPDGSCLYLVTFILDMNSYAGTFNVPEVNGEWNGWCGGCQQLFDGDGDGIFKGEHLVPEGKWEYKFAVDGLSDSEPLANNGGDFNIRTFTVSTNQTEDVFYWNSNGTYVDPCDQSLFPTAPENLSEDNSNTVTLLSWNGVPGSIGCQVQGNEIGASNFPLFFVQGNEPDAMPINNSQLTNGTTYQWRVRCGCAANPAIATPWTEWRFFTHFAQVNNETNNFLKSANVYPNPSNGEFDLTVKGTAGDMIELNIYDILGNQVQNRNLQLSSDQDSFKIEIENKRRGIYFVDITTTSSKITKKIVVE